MQMKFFLKIVSDLEISGLSEYAIAQKLGISQQRLGQLRGKNAAGKTATKLDPAILCKLRQLAKERNIEPKSWSALGKLIDREYLTSE